MTTQEMQARIEELEEIVAKQEVTIRGNTKPNNSLWLECDRPYSGITTSDLAVFRKVYYYENMNSIAAHFNGLARQIHAPYSVQKQRSKTSIGSDRFDSDCDFEKPPLIKNLTPEQFAQSVEMTRKLVAIYNEYYVKNHPSVMVLFDGDEEAVEVKISK